MTSKEHDNSLANCLLASGSSSFDSSVCFLFQCMFCFIELWNIDVNYFDSNIWICKNGRKEIYLSLVNIAIAMRLEATLTH